MKILSLILIAIIVFLLLLLIIGLLLPQKRFAKETVTFPFDIKNVWDIITNNEDYAWRSDLSKIEILNDGNSWVEYNTNGSSINFSILKKDYLKEYNFSMENNIFTGQFSSTYKKDIDGNTVVEFVESISIKNPIIRSLSYLFFNIKKFQNIYINDLKKKINS